MVGNVTARIKNHGVIRCATVSLVRMAGAGHLVTRMQALGMPAPGAGSNRLLCERMRLWRSYARLKINIRAANRPTRIL
jgi:hypothetical protein